MKVIFLILLVCSICLLCAWFLPFCSPPPSARVSGRRGRRRDSQCSVEGLECHRMDNSHWRVPPYWRRKPPPGHPFNIKTIFPGIGVLILTLAVPNLFKKHTNILTFLFIISNWEGTGVWNPSLQKTRTHLSISWLLMSWRHKEPGCLEPCYWSSFPRIFHFQNQMGSIKDQMVMKPFYLHKMVSLYWNCPWALPQYKNASSM